MQTKLKIEYQQCAEKKSGIPVIIAAAGSSSRMGGENKQFINICGIPVLARTMLAFERCDVISKIIIAAKNEDIKEIQLLAEKYMITKLCDIVEGGNNRAESIANCFKMLDGSVKKVLIHDGARPLVPDSVIKSVVSELKVSKAVTCAVPVNDTVKKVDRDGIVTETPDRSSLVAVQTPQGVWVNEYKEILSTQSDLSKFTDDMSVMEAGGYCVKTVPGSFFNFKITTPVDVFTAEGCIQREENECE